MERGVGRDERLSGIIAVLLIPCQLVAVLRVPNVCHFCGGFLFLWNIYIYIYSFFVFNIYSFLVKDISIGYKFILTFLSLKSDLEISDF